MTDRRPRFITGRDAGTGGAELLAGLHQALALALREPRSPLLLTTSTKQALEAVAPLLEPVLGHRAMTDLTRSGSCRTPYPITMVTDVTAQRTHGWRGPALLVYPSERMLDTIGGWEAVTAEVVVIWTEDQASRWAQSWNPTPIGNARLRSELDAPDPVVIQGLRALTAYINRTNRLLTREDREQAIIVIETIAHFSPSLTPEALRAYLVAKLNWDGETASAAEEILRDMLNDKRIRGRRGPDMARWSCWSAAAQRGG